MSKALTVRTPSPMVQRIMAITGVDQVIDIEAFPTPATHLGREQVTEDVSPGDVIDADTAPHALRLMTAIPADRDVVDGALRLVVALARATVSGADGVSISLSRHGRLSTVAASDQTILDMDSEQYATGEGPCVDASIEGRWFHIESLDTEVRWPTFVPKARSLGINAILSNPLIAGDRPVGALNIYSNRSGAFEATDQGIAAVFAKEASEILTDAGAGVTDEQFAQRLVEALHRREIISQAQGVIMQRDGVSPEAAYAHLRDSSRTSNRPIRDLAEEIVALVWDLSIELPLSQRCGLTSPRESDLEQGRIDSGLSHGELFLRYFELGGMSSALQLEAFLYDALQPSAHDHDIVAHALNERFVELGGNHPVPYRSDD